MNIQSSINRALGSGVALATITKHISNKSAGNSGSNAAPRTASQKISQQAMQRLRERGQIEAEQKTRTKQLLARTAAQKGTQTANRFAAALGQRAMLRDQGERLRAQYGKH